MGEGAGGQYRRGASPTGPPATNSDLAGTAIRSNSNSALSRDPGGDANTAGEGLPAKPPAVSSLKNTAGGALLAKPPAVSSPTFDSGEATPPLGRFDVHAGVAPPKQADPLEVSLYINELIDR